MDIQLTEVYNNTHEEVDPLLKQGEDLNKYSDENNGNQPKYNWDDQEYQTDLIPFINEEPTIDTQMQVAAGTVDNTVELVYNHHTRIKDHTRPSHKHNDYRALSVFWDIGGIKAYCLIDSECKGVMISPEFTRAPKFKTFPLENQLGYNWPLQIASLL